jgi:hypothetical protein
MLNKVLVSYIAVPLLALVAFGASAEIYQCTDVDTGRMIFTDKACPENTTGNAIEVKPTNASTAFTNEKEDAAKRKQRAIEQHKGQGNADQWVEKRGKDKIPGY